MANLEKCHEYLVCLKICVKAGETSFTSIKKKIVVSSVKSSRKYFVHLKRGNVTDFIDLKCLLFKNWTTKLKINIVNGLSYVILNNFELPRNM